MYQLVDSEITFGHQKPKLTKDSNFVSTFVLNIDRTLGDLNICAKTLTLV